MMELEHSLPSVKDESSPSLHDCLNRAASLVDATFGIISRVELEDLEPGEPRVFFARTEPPKINPLNNLESINYGDAVSIDSSRAMMKSIGESLERYCSAYFEPEVLRWASWKDLGESAVSPQDLQFFSREQLETPGFPYSPLEENSETNWVECQVLGSSHKKWVPAQLVFLPYPIDTFNDIRLKDQISTGMACAPDTASAIYKGILEVIERDAFMVMWLNQITPPRINLASVEDPFALALLEQLQDLPVQFETFRLTLDLEAHVILILVRNHSGTPPHTVMGLGVDLDPNRALVLALEETLLTFIGTGRFARANPDFKVEPEYRNIKTPILHALAHATCPELQPALDLFAEPPHEVPFYELRNYAAPACRKTDIAYLTRQIENQGMEALYYDLTTEDVSRAGFKVARVVVPGTQALDINHQYRHLGGKRLQTVPDKLHWARKNPGKTGFNPYPHAFP